MCLLNIDNDCDDGSDENANCSKYIFNIRTLFLSFIVKMLRYNQ